MNKYITILFILIYFSTGLSKLALNDTTYQIDEDSLKSTPITIKLENKNDR